MSTVYVKNIFWLLFERFFLLGLGAVSSVIVIRNLTIEDFGDLSFVNTIISIVLIFAGLGLKQNLVKLLSTQDSGMRKLISNSFFIVSCAGVGLIALIILTIEHIDISSQRRHLFMIYSVQLLFAVRLVFESLFESRVFSKYVVTSKILGSISLLLLLYIFTGFGLTVTGVALSYLASNMVVFVALYIFSYKIFDVRISFREFDLVLIKAVIAGSWPLLLSGLAVVLYMKVDVVMLGNMRDSREVGLYSVAIKISELLYFLPMIFASTFYPRLAKLKTESSVAYMKRFQQLIDSLFWASIACVLFVYLFGGILINSLFGVDYAESVNILMIHALALPFVFLGVASSNWFIIENLQKLTMYRTFLGLLTNLGLNYVLIEPFGGAGAAVATVVSYSVAAFFMDMIFSKSRLIFMMKLSSMNLFGASKRLLSLYSELFSSYKS